VAADRVADGGFTGLEAQCRRDGIGCPPRHRGQTIKAAGGPGRGDGDRRDRRVVGPDLSDRVLSLLTYWTRKEALLKATGDGLRIPMATITVSGPNEPPALLRWSNASGLGSSASAGLRRLHPGSGYVAALAVLDLPEVQVQELDATELLASAIG
jgi:4'-phosphopantetheinyl transferase superfamily